MMSINLVTFLSFCWYFLVRAEIIPLAIAPVRDAALSGMLTGKPMNVANVTHYIFQWLRLFHSNKHLTT